MSLVFTKVLKTLNWDIGYFRHILRLTFAKQLSYFKSAPSDLSKYKVSCKRKNCKFGTKNTWFRYFWDEILKNYCLIWNQHSGSFQKQSVIQNEKAETKNILFGILVGIRKKLLSYLIPPRPNLSKMQSFVQSKKSSKSDIKHALFGYFWDAILKNYSHIWN